MDDLIVIVDSDMLEEKAPEAAPAADKVEVRNLTRYIVCANLNSYDKNGRPAGEIWGPIGKDNVRELSRDDLESPEVRKLIKMKKLEIRR